ncbi:MAG: hypothetical protein MJZ10_08095 [Fibrobacter sp.]|nr:hypothetical protein [Fibrobacter sp.]
MKKIIYAMTFAGICAVGANAALTAVNGCYQIGTYDELKEFATKVNGGEHSACGKLTANITGNSSLHVSEGGNLRGKDCAIISCKELSFVAWTPIEGFAGTFDGNGKTISGLHMSVSSGAGLFKSVYGGAVIKNLNVADSYFRVSSSQAAGLVSKVESNSDYNEKMVVIDQCTFGGTVAGGNKTTGGTNIGGLVGVVSSGTKLLISNSVNNGRVLSSYTDYNTLSNREEVQENNVVGTNIGGLIAYVEFGATASIANCYNTGKVDDKNGTSISATVATASGTVEKDNVACLTGVANCANAEAMSSANLTSSFNNYDQSNIFAFYDAATVESIIGADTHPGVTFSDDGENGLTLVATIHDDATTFSIPQDIKVDKVVFTRQFTAEGYSTITLPFSIESSKINEGANIFARFKEVTEEDGVFTNAVGESTTSLEAYTPYLLTINSAELLVSGAVTLKKTLESATTTVGNWSFIGTMAKKRWQDDDEKQENADELGRVYGFAGSANKNDLAIGSFVKAGNKVAILPLRAYLIYSSEPEKKPAAPGAEYAPAAVASIDKLPESMRVIIVDPAPADTDEDDNQITAIKNLKAPANIVKSDRWHDVTGRSMNKPKAQGAYVNYRTPVIVK